MTKLITDTGKQTTSELLKSIRCPYWSYLSDEELDRQFPPPKKQTKRYFQWIQEADPEHKNKSVEDCDKEGLKGITLRERLIMEKLWFEKNGTHLDIKNITLCAGSRDEGGRVPHVCWSDSRLHVDWYYPSRSYGTLRARAVVSSTLEPSLDGKEMQRE